MPLVLNFDVRVDYRQMTCIDNLWVRYYGSGRQKLMEGYYTKDMTYSPEFFFLRPAPDQSRDVCLVGTLWKSYPGSLESLAWFVSFSATFNWGHAHTPPPLPPAPLPRAPHSCRVVPPARCRLPCKHHCLLVTGGCCSLCCAPELAGACPTAVCCLLPMLPTVCGYTARGLRGCVYWCRLLPNACACYAPLHPPAPLHRAPSALDKPCGRYPCPATTGTGMRG